MEKTNHEIVTINDIARMANVSKSTVSRFLNGGSVSKKTKIKIQRVIDETNYSPNTFAQSLKAKKTNMIGTIVPRLDSPSIVKSLSGMDRYLSNTNYDLLILNTYQTHEREIQGIETFVKQKVGGIILFATSLDNEYLRMLKSVNIPVIVIGQETSELHNILYADYQAGYEMGQYIRESGHKEVLYFGVTEKDIAVGVKRKQGVFDALKETKIKLVSFETSFRTQDAYQLALKILPTTEATYVCCATDNIALGVLKAARELEIELPESLSISGFGGSSMTDDVSPAITTVKYDYEEAGNLAVHSLIELINNRIIPKKLLVSTQLMVKESTRDIK